MRGYSNMTLSSNNLRASKSRSMDFSDITSPKQTFKSQLDKPKHMSNDSYPHIMEEGNSDGVADGGEDGESFGVVLKRNSSSASQRFRATEKGTAKLQGVVRRALSMRRPSSVVEGYWRIHDTCDEAVVEEEEEEEDQQQQQQQQKRTTKMSSKRKGGKFLKACKSLFRF